MTQPDRHTADTITSDALDQLYAELDRYEEIQGEMNEQAIDLTRSLARAQAEIERMKLLVAASSEDGNAVRMAAQYAERAIENGKRADQLEDLLRIAHDTSNTSEAERARAVERAERAEAAIRDALPALKAAIDCLDATCRYHGDNLDPDHHGRRYGREACCDTGVEPRRAREAQQAIARVRAALDEQQEQT